MSSISKLVIFTEASNKGRGREKDFCNKILEYLSITSYDILGFSGSASAERPKDLLREKHLRPEKISKILFLIDEDYNWIRDNKLNEVIEILRENSYSNPCYFIIIKPEWEILYIYNPEVAEIILSISSDKYDEIKSEIEEAIRKNILKEWYENEKKKYRIKRCELKEQNKNKYFEVFEKAFKANIETFKGAQQDKFAAEYITIKKYSI